MDTVRRAPQTLTVLRKESPIVIPEVSPIDHERLSRWVVGKVEHVPELVQRVEDDLLRTSGRIGGLEGAQKQGTCLTGDTVIGRVVTERVVA
jgi:hypothetical protein